MASWTFDEPWPNAAHGSVIDYYGLTKMAFYHVRDALRPKYSVSLKYSDAWVKVPASDEEDVRGEDFSSVWVVSDEEFRVESTFVL